MNRQDNSDAPTAAAEIGMTQIPRRCRRTKQTLAAPRHIDRHVQEELSKLVWVTVGKTEHQAWLLEEMAGTFTVKIRWESTGQEDRVPILSVRYEAAGGGRRTRRRRPAEAPTTIQRSKKRPKRESSKQKLKKDSKPPSKVKSETSKHASSKKHAEESSEKEKAKIFPQGCRGGNDSEEKSVPKEKKSLYVQPNVFPSPRNSSHSAPSKTSVACPTGIKRTVSVPIGTEIGRPSIPVVDGADSSGDKPECERSLVKAQTSKINKSQWKKDSAPRRVSATCYNPVSTMRTMETFNGRWNHIAAKRTVFHSSGPFLEC